jgi:hypothetical protein
MMSRDRLEQLLHTFPRLRIGLVGDLFLDRYLEIDAARREMSIETGLEAYQVTAVRNSPGALGQPRRARRGPAGSRHRARR